MIRPVLQLCTNHEIAQLNLDSAKSDRLWNCETDTLRIQLPSPPISTASLTGEVGSHVTKQQLVAAFYWRMQHCLHFSWDSDGFLFHLACVLVCGRRVVPHNWLVPTRMLNIKPAPQEFGIIGKLSSFDRKLASTESTSKCDSKVPSCATEHRRGRVQIAPIVPWMNGKWTPTSPVTVSLQVLLQIKWKHLSLLLSG